MDATPTMFLSPWIQQHLDLRLASAVEASLEQLSQHIIMINFTGMKNIYTYYILVIYFLTDIQITLRP